VQPLFVSVDPLRDTPAVMAEYVAAFHPRIVGLTGTEEQVRRAAAAFRVYYASGRDAGSTVPPAEDDYLVSHSAFTYLMAPDMTLRALFAHGTAPEDMSAKIRQVVADGQ
jgi:protein SCO1/2